MRYRIHSDNAHEAVDLNVWGPRGYMFEPDYENVTRARDGIWDAIPPTINKITRNHAALLLRWARRHNRPVERFKR